MAWNVGLLCVPVTVISCVDHNKSPSCWFRGLPGLHSKFQVLPCHQDLCSLQHLQSSRQKDIELEDVFQAWVAFRMSQSKMASRQDKWKQGKLNYIKLSLEDLGSVQLYNWESTHQVPAMDFPPITEIKAETMSAKLVRRLEVHRSNKWNLRAFIEGLARAQWCWSWRCGTWEAAQSTALRARVQSRRYTSLEAWWGGGALWESNVANVAMENPL